MILNKTLDFHKIKINWRKIKEEIQISQNQVNLRSKDTNNKVENHHWGNSKVLEAGEKVWKEMRLI